VPDIGHGAVGRGVAVSGSTGSDLAKVLELACSAPSRYRTLRATVRDWSSYKRISALQQIPWGDDGAEESGERVVRIHVKSDGKVREVSDTGDVREHEDWGTYEPLLAPGLDEQATPGFELLGRATQAGRAGWQLRTGPCYAEFLLPGSDRCELVVDAERGILLRAAAFHADELLMVEELLDVAFDDDADTQR
jgi:hypothetical protein